MKTKWENQGLFLFALIDQLFPSDRESTEQEHMVSDRLYFGLLISAALIAILLGAFRWVWMSE